VLEYLVITHSHHDHYASAEPLMRKLDNITLVMYGDAVKNIGEANRVQVQDKDTFHVGRKNKSSYQDKPCKGDLYSKFKTKS